MSRGRYDHYSTYDTELGDWNQSPKKGHCRHGISYGERCRGCRRTRTGMVAYECRSCRQVELAPAIEDPYRFLCPYCYERFRQEKARKESPPPVQYASESSIHSDDVYDTIRFDEPSAHNAIYDAKANGAARYLIDFSVWASAPGLVQNRKVFEEHMARLKAEISPLIEARLTALGLSEVEVRNWQTSGRWAVRIIRKYQIFEVLPSGKERETDGEARSRKQAVSRAAVLAKETGLTHRLWPVLTPSGNYRKSPVVLPKDEQCDVLPSGETIWRRHEEQLPGATEDDEEDS